ncbi:hypothetical protein DLM45_02230 [Hyphomicrobium methylovorum]|nr:hypothetical protein [Hyphomicrobium methylovorum]
MSKKLPPRAALSKRFLSISLTTVIGATISGCSSLPIDSGCKSFAPIHWSRQDTAQTQREVVAHNRAWDSICKG